MLTRLALSVVLPIALLAGCQGGGDGGDGYKWKATLPGAPGVYSSTPIGMPSSYQKIAPNGEVHVSRCLCDADHAIMTTGEVNLLPPDSYALDRYREIKASMYAEIEAACVHRAHKLAGADYMLDECEPYSPSSELTNPGRCVPDESCPDVGDGMTGQWFPTGGNNNDDDDPTAPWATGGGGSSSGN